MSLYQATLFHADDSIYVGDYSIRRIDHKEAIPFILNIHMQKEFQV